MARPAAFLQQVHRRYGDPVTIRTYWTAEPMVLFSDPAAVRDVFGLDPEIAPAGRSWEFLRPFAGPHSILLLDGPGHIRERKLLQAPFHGERMRALAPLVRTLAAREFETWSGRVNALERMRALTLNVILRVVFGAGGRDADDLRACIEDTLGSVRSLPAMLAMAITQRDLGPRSPWGRFRAKVERFDAHLQAYIERSEIDPNSVLAGLDQTDFKHLRDQLVALLVGGHDSTASSLAWAFELLSRHPHVQANIRDKGSAYATLVVKEVLRARPALTIAPRLLLEPARIDNIELPAGVQVAACLWLSMRRHDLWPDAARFRPERWLERPQDPAWIPYGGGVRRCAGAPFAEMEMREVLLAASHLELRPASRRPERARRSMLVVVPERGAEVVVR
jgi:cytochrome P450